jgi:hypothetical protein
MQPTPIPLLLTLSHLYGTTFVNMSNDTTNVPKICEVLISKGHHFGGTPSLTGLIKPLISGALNGSIADVLQWWRLNEISAGAKVQNNKDLLCVLTVT